MTPLTEAPVHRPTDASLRLVRRARAFEDEEAPWRRGLIATNVWREHPDRPIVWKRAETVAQALEQIAPVVLPEDAVIGICYRRLRVHRGVGDHDAWRRHAKHPETLSCPTNMPIPPEADREIQWWRDHPETRPTNPNPARRAHASLGRYGIANPHGMMNGHTLPDHGILLARGIGGLRRDIAERMTRPMDASQEIQLRAMDRILEGLAAHARLCATSARTKAQEVADPELRRDLEGAAQRCEALADAPPRTFAQALQLLTFSNCADILDNPGDASSFGRIDQLLHPFYQADIESGRLTPADAFDLVCRFLIKKWQVQSSNNMTLGGLTPDGRDATNALSTMFLEAMEQTRMPTDLTARVHTQTPPAFLRTIARVMRCGMGRPSMYNDDAVIPALVAKGIDIEDARDYAPLGCAEVMIPGRTAYRTMSMGLNLNKVLELVLHEGRCAVTGDRVWENIPSDFETFDALLATYHGQVRHVVDPGVEIIREDERLEPEIAPRPWMTVLSRGGIEAARDITAGQPKYDAVGVTLDGIADVANSLEAIRRLVYTDKRVTLAQLRRILCNNWEGNEELRLHAINDFPRFGQDAPEANRLAAAEAAYYASCFESHRTFYGGRFWPMIFGVGSGFVHRKNHQTGATPSGRRAGEDLAMSLQPSPSGPRGCVTSLLRACAGIDFHAFPGGISNVQDVDPSHFADSDGLDRLTQILRTFCDMGGMEVALNFLDEAKLREAQKKPEEYQHLMVRLFGLSARYVDLDDAMQDHVIARVRAGAAAT